MLVIAVMALAVVASRPSAYSISRRRAAPVVDEVQFAATVAAELRVGRALRQALLDALDGIPTRPAVELRRHLVSGTPLVRAAAGVSQVLPDSGPMVVAAIRMAAESGGAVAPLFDRIADQQIGALAIDRERRAATAQIRLSAIVIGVLPLVVTGLMLVTGRLGALVQTGSFGVGVVALGASMQIVGLAVISLLIRSAT
jgi:tight adherence protein B